MAPININIKASNDQKYSIEFDTEKTVLELKQEIEKVASIEPTRQRLIYSGRVLSKDEEKVETYKVKDGNTLHLVQAKAPAPASTESTTAPQPQIPMSAGTGAGNPLAGLTGARYAGQLGLPNASMFGADGGMTGGFGGEDMSEMLSQPGVREAMESAFSNPQFIDQMMASNPQLRNAPPYVRQMLQSPEFRRQMLDPNFIRQMGQMQQMMGGQQQQRSAFPAPGPTTGTNPDQTTTSAQSNLPDLSQMMQMFGGGQQQAQQQSTTQQGQAPNPFAQMMQNPAMFQSMFGGMGMPAAAENPADTRPPEERYADQLRQLNDMGFFEFDRNVSALRRAGGSVQGAIEALLNGSV